MNEESGIRSGSSPNFCPPIEEGITLSFADENGDETLLEFLGILIVDDRSYGFFFMVDEDNPALSSGDVIVLEVVGTDSEGIPEDFEMVDDAWLTERLFIEFKKATKDLYRFED